MLFYILQLWYNHVATLLCLLLWAALCPFTAIRTFFKSKILLAQLPSLQMECILQLLFYYESYLWFGLKELRGEALKAFCLMGEWSCLLLQQPDTWQLDSSITESHCLPNLQLIGTLISDPAVFISPCLLSWCVFPTWCIFEEGPCCCCLFWALFLKLSFFLLFLCWYDFGFHIHGPLVFFNIGKKFPTVQQ